MHDSNLGAMNIVLAPLAHKGRRLRENAPPQFAAQIRDIAQSLQSPEAPPEMHALGRVLAALLTGERHPDLSALPPELASKIREYLQS
ncbi:MAG: hypothetical protein ALAOOOJD_03282 [bacterium]|nr:hypothetical protein [bacterium]